MNQLMINKNSRRRRRNNAVLVATTLFASSSTSSAFSSPPMARPLQCQSATRQFPLSPLRDDESMISNRSHSSYHVLNMVSFLEMPPTTTNTAAISPPPRKAAVTRNNIRSNNIKLNNRGGGINVPQKDIRTVEIQLQNEFLGLVADDFAVSTSNKEEEHEQLTPAQISAYGGVSNRDAILAEIDQDRKSNRHISPPEIDSEILYEGITRAAPTPLQPEASVIKRTASTSPSSSMANEFGVPTYNKKPTITKRIIKNRKKSKNQSSTMPGFIKDEGLDKHITNLDMARLPNTQESRKLIRKVNTKRAKIKRRQTNSEMLYKKSASVPDSMLDYAREIHSVERVTPKEEKELGTKTQEAIRIQQLHDELQNKYGREPTDDEWAAAAGKMNVVALKEALEDGMAAKNQLVASNLRMVQRVVNLYIRNGLGSEYNAGDLMQDGTMALIRAAEKYEPDRGFRFSTYAMYWIRSAVKRSQTSQSRIVTVPQRLHETHKRVSKNEVHLLKELGRQPNKAELAEASDITVLQLERCQKAMSQVTFSLDAEIQNTNKPNSSNRKDTMYNIVEGKVDETEYERTQRLLMKDHLIGTLRRYLSPHEVDLLLLRYGLMDERALPKGMSGPLTIAEVSKLVGLKPDKVRRIIINSQKQLKHLMNDQWSDFDIELA